MDFFEPAYDVRSSVEDDAVDQEIGFEDRSRSLLFSAQTAVIVYVFVAITLVIRILARLWRTSRAISRLSFIARQPVELRMGAANISPFAWCLVNRCIVVPTQWFDWNTEKQHSVMLHESAHISRRDGLTSVAISIVCALCWINPLIWYARRRSQMLAEQACDDAVVHQGVDETLYARHLLEISRMRAHELAPSMAQLSQLGCRIKALLDEDNRKKPMTQRLKLALMGTTAAFVFAIFSVGFAGDALAKTKTVRTEIVTKLATAQVHIEEERFDDGRRVLDEARKLHDLTPNEIAQIANMEGFRLFRSGDYKASIEAYERVVSAKSIPSELRTITLYTLAQLNYVVEDYASSVEYMRRWESLATDPGPIPKVFVAQTYYQMQDFEQASEELDRALAIAEAKGITINPNWKALQSHLVEIRNGTTESPPPHTGLDGEYFPIVKVAPVYPAAAKQHKIEGHVVVEFSVGTDGRPTNLTVVEAVPPEIFDQAALNAVRKFKYKPRVEKGAPVAVPGVRNLIRFALDQS